MKKLKALFLALPVAVVVNFSDLNLAQAQNTNGADSIRQGTAGGPNTPGTNDTAGYSGSSSASPSGAATTNAGTGSNNLQGDTGRQIIDQGSIETGDTGENDHSSSNWGWLGLL